MGKWYREEFGKTMNFLAFGAKEEKIVTLDFLRRTEVTTQLGEGPKSRR